MKSMRLWKPGHLFYWDLAHRTNRECGGRGREAETDRVIRIINHLAEQLTAGRLKVLLLFAGFDGAATDNDSWSEMEKRFPDVDFSITSVNYNGFGTSSREVIHKRCSDNS
jgi:hypothetical protein